MKSDRHIVERYEQITEGSEVETLCGEKILKARIQPMSETDYIPGASVNATPAKGICSKCQKVRMYRYLVVDSELVTEGE